MRALSPLTAEGGPAVTWLAMLLWQRPLGARKWLRPRGTELPCRVPESAVSAHFHKWTRVSMAAAGGRRFSERVRARLAAVDEPWAAETLLFALVGDPLRAIARLLPDEDRFRMRLACATMRDHASRQRASAASASCARDRWRRTRATRSPALC